MKNFRSTPRCRWLARAAAVLLLLPYLACAPRAHAQQATPNVYVLDFNNDTKVGGALLGRVAAAQMSLQLSESENWFVVPDAQVERRIQELNLLRPFDRPARVQIATGIDATAVVYGNVLEASVSAGASPQAYVKMQVLVEDISTGVLMNGAIAEGASTKRMGFAGNADVLLEEALGKAAFRAREFMDRFRLPEGTVLNTTVVGEGDNIQVDALINIGARQGMRRGMEMIATRQKQLVGHVKITSVDSDISSGKILSSTQGVRPEDKVRAIFNFSDFPATRSRLRSAEPGAGVHLASSAVPGEAADGAAAKVARTERTAQFTPFGAKSDASAEIAQATLQPPPKVVVDEPEVERAGGVSGGRGGRKIISTPAVRMLVGGMLLLGVLELGGNGGTNYDRAIEISGFGYQIQVGTPSAFIRVLWARPKGVTSNEVLQYIVWRADTNGGFLMVGALDGDTLHSFLDTEATRTVNAYSGVPGSNAIGTITAVANVPGIVPGQEYRYQIGTAFTVGDTHVTQCACPCGGGGGGGVGCVGGGGGLGGGGGIAARPAARPRAVPHQCCTTCANMMNFMSPLSQSTGWVTAIAPPTVSSPTQDTQVPLSNLSVSWAQTPGADTYAIWLSPSPSFPAGRRVMFGPFQTLRVDEGGDPTVTQTIDASSKKIVANPKVHVVYIAVGGKNSYDQTPPKPFGYIFSAPVAIQPPQTPPPPPNGSTSGVRPGGVRSGTPARTH